MSDDRLEREQYDFLEQHKDADMLEFGAVSKVCLAAVYFSPKEKHEQRPLRQFLKAVQEAEVEQQWRGSKGDE